MRFAVVAVLLFGCSRASSPVSSDPAPCDCRCAPSTPPLASSSAPSLAADLLVAVGAHGVLVDAQEAATDADVDRLVRQHRETRGDGDIHLFATKEVDFGRILHVLDLVRAGGMKGNVHFAEAKPVSVP